MTISETDDHLRSIDNAVTVSKSTAAVKFSLSGQLAIAVVADDSSGTSQVSIYGDPKGLLELADLLTAFAKLDQEAVSDQNCPNGEGVHTTLTSELGLVNESVVLNLGRLDAKGTHDSQWFLTHPAVTIIPQSDCGEAK